MLSTFWNHNQPKTRWAPVSLSFFCSSSFGAVFLHLCLPCYNLLWAVLVLFYCSSLGGQTKKGKSRRPRPLAEGPAWLGWCFGFSPVFSGPMGRQRHAGISLRKGIRVLLPCLAQPVSEPELHIFLLRPRCWADLSLGVSRVGHGVGAEGLGPWWQGVCSLLLPAVAPT